MATITKEKEFERSEDYGGGNAKIIVEYQSVSDTVRVQLIYPFADKIDLCVSRDEWDDINDLVNEAVKVKRGY